MLNHRALNNNSFLIVIVFDIVILFQVFLFKSNNLHTVTMFQVFLSIIAI